MQGRVLTEEKTEGLVCWVIVKTEPLNRIKTLKSANTEQDNLRHGTVLGLWNPAQDGQRAFYVKVTQPFLSRASVVKE